MTWVDIDIEVVQETEKAVLLDFGSYLRNNGFQTWVPKSQFRETVVNNFQVQQIKKSWVAMNDLWRHI